MASLLDTLPRSRMRTLVTGPQHGEWAALRDDWKRARTALDLNDTDKNTDAEQLAWDTWCDWVEENNLNYTLYDPRGTEDPGDSELKATSIHA